MPVLFPKAVNLVSNWTLFGFDDVAGISPAFDSIDYFEPCAEGTVADDSLRRDSTQSGRGK